MPVSGPKPKPEGQRRHRVKPTFDWTEVHNVPFDDGPELPDRPNGKPWPARTVAWWGAVSSMPHCVMWGRSDWSYAFDAAVIAALLHEGDLRAAAPLERREKIMGTTADYRRDLRIRYVETEEEAQHASVTALSDYQRVLGA